MQANIDGSTSVQLNFNGASRTETQTRISDDRECQWIDKSGTSHDILGPNCFVALPWFVPNLFVRSAGQLPPMVTISDDGEVSKGDATLHQISYVLKMEGKDAASTKQLVDASAVHVFYDPKTLLPSSLEYSIYSDSNSSQPLKVRVVFSDFRFVSGIEIPFHIERFVNRSLQLKLNVNNVSIE